MEREAGLKREDLIYSRRFSLVEAKTRDLTWRILCSDFLQRYVSPDDVVVDVGAGDGGFVRHIAARRRIAVDYSSHVSDLENCGIDVVVASASDFAAHLSEAADVIFISNLLEHLPKKEYVFDVLEECARALKPTGRLLVLQPSVRHVGAAYWDYIDHHIALTEHSLVEALEVSGYEVSELIERFLPYTAKSFAGSLVSGRREWMIRLYLRCPVLWKLFGQQSFVVAKLAECDRRT